MPAMAPPRPGATPAPGELQPRRSRPTAPIDAALLPARAPAMTPSALAVSAVPTHAAALVPTQPLVAAPVVPQVSTPEPDPAPVAVALDATAPVAPAPVVPVSMAPPPEGPAPIAPSIAAPGPAILTSSPDDGREAPEVPQAIGRNQFGEDEEGKTIADVIPANTEASRSMQSEPSWNVARQSVALGELQRWVQETRNFPKPKLQSLSTGFKQANQRAMTWAYRHRLPRWLPHAGVVVVILWLVLFIAMCAGGRPAKPAEGGAAPAEHRR
jgi:hypothetical protein